MDSNVVTTEVLRKMSIIFSKAGYLKAKKDESMLPFKVPGVKTLNIKEEKELNELLKNFKNENGTHFSFVSEEVNKIINQ
jgi:hypothetical protein